MKRILILGLFLFVSVVTVNAAGLILNEYNAVDNDEFLDNDGSDTYWGQVEGNGKDWFELVVVDDHLDVRGWTLDIYDDGDLNQSLTLSDHALWSNLRSGMIITVSEDLADDLSYDYDSDWWINIQSSDDAGDTFITNPSDFKVSKDDWQLVIKDAQDNIIFGPAGEGINPDGGIGKDEVFKLEANPSSAITPMSDYNDGTSSTFGAPNVWGGGSITQDFSALRAVVPEPATLLLLGMGSTVLLRRRRK